MDRLVAENKKLITPSPHRLTSLVIILLLICGLASSLFAGITVDFRGRDYLVGRAQTIADSLPAEAVTFLEGRPDDINTFEYAQVQAILERVLANNSDLSDVYIMQNRPADPIYVVDATPAGQPDFNPPGTVHTEGSEQLRSGFSSSQAFIEGPSRDSWGLWLSALAPITDPATNRTIAWVGIDTPALQYYAEVAIYALVPLILTAIPLAGLLRDRKLAQKEWEIANLKQQFVSIASHELRSPITGMVWAIQSLIKSGQQNLTDAQKDLLNDMFQSAQASTATINEILDLTVFQQKQAQGGDHSIVDLTSIVREANKTLRLGAQQKRLQVELQHFPETAYTVGDLAGLKRAVMNLLSNAIKYSFEGSTIYVKYRYDDGRHVISVQDHGIGIPKQDQANVLKGYYRAHNATVAQVRGTGMGLWMTKLIVEEHGGQLTLFSQEGVGTTVSISLPATAELKSVTPVKNQAPQRHDRLFRRVKGWFSRGR